MDSNSVGVVVLRGNPGIPSYGTKLSACADISVNLEGLKWVEAFSPVNEKRFISIDANSVSIPPKWRVLIPTGIGLQIPEGYSVRTHPRSGMSYKHGLTIICSQGVIDEDYQKELFVPVVNTSEVEVVIQSGLRIAQMELVKDLRASFRFIDSFSDKDSDRSGGFGHTGSI